MRHMARNHTGHNFTGLTGLVLWFVIMMSLPWGCAVTPAKKVYIEDLSQEFEEGTIISTGLGKIVAFDEMLADLNDCRITYVGEKHTNAGHHDIQLKIIRAVFSENPNMTVGMEMFDHTYQDVLDSWSAGRLNERTFLRKVHWYANWRYDYSLYRGILEYIRENNIRLVGLNIPFHIPRKIRVGGIENLRDDEKDKLPREIDTSNMAHREYLREIFGHHHFRGEVDFEDFYMAQAAWEDAMAEKVALNLNNSAMVVLAMVLAACGGQPTAAPTEPPPPPAETDAPEAPPEEPPAEEMPEVGFDVIPGGFLERALAGEFAGLVIMLLF